MKRIVLIVLSILITLGLSGCLFERIFSTPPRIIRYVVTATPEIYTLIPTEDIGPIQKGSKPTGQPKTIATAQILPTSTPTKAAPTASRTPGLPTPIHPTVTQTPAFPTATWTPEIPVSNIPTPIPDHVPGNGMGVLVGDSPYQLNIVPGGWQAYLIGPSALERGYLVDVTPLGLAVNGTHIETRIVQEFMGGQWIDALWIRSPEIQADLPVQVNLLSSDDWIVRFDAEVTLTPGEWMGFGMFQNAEGCGGVLDISMIDLNPPPAGSFIFNTRVQPEFPKPDWIQVARVQLNSESIRQQARLKYYVPGEMAVEVLRMETTLSPGVWSGWVVAPSSAHQGYVVEVIPVEKVDNEIAFSLVQPEFDGKDWNDVLRLYVPEGRPPMDVLVRVLAIVDE